MEVSPHNLGLPPSTNLPEAKVAEPSSAEEASKKGGRPKPKPMGAMSIAASTLTSLQQKANLSTTAKTHLNKYSMKVSLVKPKGQESSEVIAILGTLRTKETLPLSSVKQLWFDISQLSPHVEVNQKLFLELSQLIVNHCHQLESSLNLQPNCQPRFTAYVLAIAGMLSTKNLQLDRLINLLISGYDFFVAPKKAVIPSNTTIAPPVIEKPKPKTTTAPPPKIKVKPYELIAPKMCAPDKIIWSRRNGNRQFDNTPTGVIKSYFAQYTKKEFELDIYEEFYSWNKAPIPLQDVWDTFLIQDFLGRWRKELKVKWGKDGWSWGGTEMTDKRWLIDYAEDYVKTPYKPKYCSITVQDKNKLCDFIWEKKKDIFKSGTYYSDPPVQSGDMNTYILGEEVANKLPYIIGYTEPNFYDLSRHPQLKEATCLSYYNDTSVIDGWNATTPAPPAPPTTPPILTTPLPTTPEPTTIVPVTYEPFPTASTEFIHLASSLSTSAVICFSLVPTFLTEVPALRRSPSMCRKLHHLVNLTAVSCITLSSIVNLSAQMANDTEQEVTTGSSLAAIGSGLYTVSGLWSALELYKELTKIRRSLAQIGQQQGGQILTRCAQLSATQTSNLLNLNLVKQVAGNCSYLATHLYDICMPQFFPAMAYLKTMPCVLINALSLLTMARLDHEAQQIDESLIDAESPESHISPLILLQHSALTHAAELSAALAELFESKCHYFLQKCGGKIHSDEEEKVIATLFLSSLTQDQTEKTKIETAVARIYGFKPLECHLSQLPETYIADKTVRILLKYLDHLRRQDKCWIFPVRGLCYSNNVYTSFIVPLMNALAYRELQTMNTRQREHFTMDMEISDDHFEDALEDVNEMTKFNISAEHSEDTEDEKFFLARETWEYSIDMSFYDEPNVNEQPVDSEVRNEESFEMSQVSRVSDTNEVARSTTEKEGTEEDSIEEEGTEEESIEAVTTKKISLQSEFPEYFKASAIRAMPAIRCANLSNKVSMAPQVKMPAIPPQPITTDVIAQIHSRSSSAASLLSLSRKSSKDESSETIATIEDRTTPQSSTSSSPQTLTRLELILSRNPLVAHVAQDRNDITSLDE